VTGTAPPWSAPRRPRGPGGRGLRSEHLGTSASAGPQNFLLAIGPLLPPGRPGPAETTADGPDHLNRLDDDGKVRPSPCPPFNPNCVHADEGRTHHHRPAFGQATVRKGSARQKARCVPFPASAGLLVDDRSGRSNALCSCHESGRRGSRESPRVAEARYGFLAFAWADMGKARSAHVRPRGRKYGRLGFPRAPAGSSRGLMNEVAKANGGTLRNWEDRMFFSAAISA